VAENKQSRMRGRPVDPQAQEVQKLKLISAANRLLNSKTYKTITIREIAQLAGTKSAMISYYFGHKQGLFQAMVTHIHQSQPDVFSHIQQAEKPLKFFISHVLNMASNNPGLVRFIHDEILNEQSPLSESFINAMPKAISVFLPELIKREIDKGNFRADLNPKYAAFSLMVMIMSPFVIAPIREQVWQISLHEITQPSWAEHIYNLFISGCSQ
jgi:AcrR family transcriptional regulator